MFCLGIYCLGVFYLGVSCLGISCLDISYLDISCLDMSYLDISCLGILISRFSSLYSTNTYVCSSVSSLSFTKRALSLLIIFL